MDFEKKYSFLNLTPQKTLKLLYDVDFVLKCVPPEKFINEELPEYSIEKQIEIRNHRKIVIGNYIILKYRIENKAKILNGIIALQRRYKSYLYSPESEYYKRLIENGENKLKEFA